MTNSTLPTNITPGGGDFEGDVERAWAEINELSRDTGWRNVTTLILNGWTADFIAVRRVRDEVKWLWKNLNGTNATSVRIVDFAAGIGNGFSPGVAAAFGGNRQWESPVFRVGATFDYYFIAGISEGFRGSVTGKSLGTAERSLSYPTNATFPSLAALPGVAI